MMGMHLTNCPLCGKPYVRSYTLQQNKLMPMLYGAPAEPDEFCKGHTSIRCEICGWMVPEGHHSRENCEKVQAIFGTARTMVPTAFYKAFENEDMRL